MKKRNYYLAQEVAEILGVTKRTLWNWEEAGKIPKARRDPMSGFRLYSEKDIKRLKKITGRPL